MADKFDAIEQNLEMFIENVRQLGIIVCDFQPQGQSGLNQKINNIISGLQELDKLKGGVQDVHVPMGVFEYIDRGKNPQLYTKECMERAQQKNEQVKGKIETLNRFRAQLMVELTKVFPGEMSKYRALRGDEKPL